jgi:hypothetical protein
MIHVADAARRSLEQALDEAMDLAERAVDDDDLAVWLVALSRVEKLEEMLGAMG